MAALVYKVATMQSRRLRLSCTTGTLIVALVTAAAAQQLTSDHPGEYARPDILTGGEVYRVQCLHCHGRGGDEVSGVNLRTQQFRLASSDEELAAVITGGTPGGMPPFALPPAELTGVVAFIRAGFDTSAPVELGDPARGRAIYEGKGACGSCHRVQGTGPRVAPDLSDIGLARTPAALERSLVSPTAAMLPINRPVRIVTTGGAVLTGRRLNEDTHTVQIIDEQERLVSLDKREISSLEVSTTSPMPSYADRLTDDEIADVVAYLLTLRTP